MRELVIRRLIGSLATLFGVCVLVFGMVQALPGDPARVIAGLNASPQDVQRIREELKLDQSLPAQFSFYLKGVAVGDLGVSARSGRSVTTEIADRLPATIGLAIAAVLTATVAGILLGILAALRPNSPLDYGVSAMAIGASSMPTFWLGLLLILLFSVHFQLLPSAGMLTWKSWILPTLTLASFSLALIARVTRAAMLEVLKQDYIRTARAKGVQEWLVIYRHGLRNAMLPVITVIGLQFGQLMGGAVLTEVVFSWPGIGRLLVDSIFARDFPIVQGVILVYGALIIVINLLVDLSYAVFDPRIRN